MKTLKTIFLWVFIFSRVDALELNITNDINDIFSTKNINVYFELAKETHAVLCSTINFSVDNPSIAIIGSACSQRPSVEFLQSFKRGKKVFTQPFYYELKIKIALADQSQAFEELKRTSLYASCFAVERSGHIRAMSLCKPLYDEVLIGAFPQKSGLDVLTQTDTLNTLTSFFIKDRLKNTLGYKNFEIEPENMAIANLKGLTVFIVERVNDLADRINFFLVYLIIFILATLLLVLMARYDFVRTWMSGLVRLLVFVWFILTFFFFKARLVPYKFYVCLAALFIVISLYYIFSAKTESAKDKLKSLFGFILAATAIPLLLKAFLLFNNIN